MAYCSRFQYPVASAPVPQQYAGVCELGLLSNKQKKEDRVVHGRVLYEMISPLRIPIKQKSDINFEGSASPGPALILGCAKQYDEESTLACNSCKCVMACPNGAKTGAKQSDRFGAWGAKLLLGSRCKCATATRFASLPEGRYEGYEATTIARRDLELGQKESN